MQNYCLSARKEKLNRVSFLNEDTHSCSFGSVDFIEVCG